MSRGNWFHNRGAATATERHIVSYGAVSQWFILLQKLLICIIFLNNPVKKKLHFHDFANKSPPIKNKQITPK